jgi:hypothetical protein
LNLGLDDATGEGVTALGTAFTVEEVGDCCPPLMARDPATAAMAVVVMDVVVDVAIFEIDRYLEN